MQDIIVTTDFSAESFKALPYAAEQARLHGKGGAKVTLISVLSDQIHVGVQFEFGFTFTDVQGALDRAAKEAETKLTELVGQYFREVEATSKLLRTGDPVAVAVADFAKATKADLIVISTHGRTGVSHLVIGSVAERVVRLSPCPVLVVPVKQ